MRRPLGILKALNQLNEKEAFTIQTSLALSLIYGRHYRRNIPLGVSLLEEGAKYGYLRSITALGTFYLKGHAKDKNFPADPKKAKVYFEKGVTLGSGMASYYIGYMAHHGVGVRTDLKEAVKHYDVAAKKGYRKARRALQELADQGNQEAKKALETLPAQKKK